MAATYYRVLRRRAANSRMNADGCVAEVRDV